MKIRTTSIVLLLAAFFANACLANEEYWEYTFRPGDSIWKIAKEHTTSVNNWSEIQRINNIAKGPDRTIQPGARIKIPIHMLKQQPVPATVVAVRGAVKVVRADGASATATVGSHLYSGDQVITTAAQSLRMQFADGSELQVEAHSKIKLDKLSYHEKTGMVDTRVRLQQGRANTWVEKLKPKSRYQIQTPAAITAVRGTAYRLSSDENQISRTEVTEGNVGVSAGGDTQQVESGYGLVVEQGKPLSAPVKLLSAPGISDNQSRVHGQLELAWTTLDGAANYRYQLAQDAAFDLLVLNESTQQTKLKVSDLKPGDYFLRVRGIAANKLEGLNATRSFRIEPKPPNPGHAEKVIIPSGMLILGQ